MRLGVIAVFGVVSLLAQESSETQKGVRPRATPEDYPVQAKDKSGSYAATLVPSDRVSQMFAADISQKYLVVEVAYFPRDNQMTMIDTDDFVIKPSIKGEPTHNSDPAAIASSIQKSVAPKVPTELGNDTHVRTEAEIGYEHGRDPVTGRTVSGTYERVGVGVEHGGPAAPPPMKPGETYEDRKKLEAQLSDRQLPSGKVDHPVAGFLYFPKSQLKKDKSGNYLLVHLADSNVELPIPAKNK